MNLYMYVLPEERYFWQNYSAKHGPEWVEDIMDLQERQGTFQDTLQELGVANFDNVTFWNVIHDYDEWDKDESEMGKVGLSPDDPGPFFPMWQTTYVCLPCPLCMLSQPSSRFDSLDHGQSTDSR
jgi:hypothetical protein